MLRFIILLIAISILVFVCKKTWQKLQQNHQQQAKPKEAIVPCEICQVHTPKSEAITYEGYFFCSEEHKEQWIQGKK